MLCGLLLSLLTVSSWAADTDEELLPAGCDCRDWYGGCRPQGDRWTDEDTWNYECSGAGGADATFLGCQSASGDVVPVGHNTTLNHLWHSCSADESRLKYETEPHCLVNGNVRRLGETFKEGRFQWLCLETGRWVTGCYFVNETRSDVLLKIGETGYNGLVKHVCDRFVDYPGRVQYYAEVRDDVHVKQPTNKGINKNFQEPAELTLEDKVDRWQHESAALFTGDDSSTRTKVRFLPASRKNW